MRIGYLECFAGIAGDMFLGALVDAGVEPQALQQAADGLKLGVTLEFTKVDRSGIQSTKARVLVGDVEADAPKQAGATERLHTHAHTHTHTHTQDGVTHSHEHTHMHVEGGNVVTHSHEHGSEGLGHEEHGHGRSLTAIRKLIAEAPLSAGAKRMALDAFARLGAAEAKIHGVPVERIHFHEVGAVDAIIDIVCGAVGADLLQVDAWYGSAVNVGSGFVDCAHGRFPVPAPATAELLAGVPVYAEGPAKEMTTPTGAALLRALGCRFEARPVMRSSLNGLGIGYGAGTRNPERFPNVLRLTVGEIEGPGVSAGEAGERREDRVAVLECSIDDASPEMLAYAAGELMEHGALDVTQQALLMKKGRQGTLLTVLCRPEEVLLFEELLFRETTTLGVRKREETRSILERSSERVETVYGGIRVKVGRHLGEVCNVAPEFEDCRAAAEEYGVALKAVMQAAAAVAWGKWSQQEAQSGKRELTLSSALSEVR